MGANINFLDFGASKGGSLKFASSVFGGSGKGVDIDGKKIDKLIESGLDGIVQDVTAMKFDDNSVNYVTMMNFLEHLPNKEIGYKAIASALRVASDFVFMVGPNFGHEKFLKKYGLRKSFASWSGHTWRHETTELSSMLDSFSEYDVSIVEYDRIFDSNDEYIVPVDAPINASLYDRTAHSQKDYVDFGSRKVYKWIAFAVSKTPEIRSEEVLIRGVHSKTFKKVGRNNTLYK